MKKFIAYIILISFIFVHTGLSTVSIAAESAQSSNVVNKSDDTFKGRAEITDKADRENKELFTGEVDQLEAKDVIKMTVSQVLSSGYTEEGDEFLRKSPVKWRAIKG